MKFKTAVKTWPSFITKTGRIHFVRSFYRTLDNKVKGSGICGTQVYGSFNLENKLTGISAYCPHCLETMEATK